MAVEKLAKIKDFPELRRGDTGAVLNVDNSKLMAYRKQREQQNQFSQAMDDINTLKADMETIKATLGQILGALKTNG